MVRQPDYSGSVCRLPRPKLTISEIKNRKGNNLFHIATWATNEDVDVTSLLTDGILYRKGQIRQKIKNVKCKKQRERFQEELKYLDKIEKSLLDISR